MALSHEEVLHVAHLSKLPLTQEEVDEYARELSPVVDYFKELSNVDTEGVVGTSQTTGLMDVLRPDEVDDLSRLTAEEALSQSEREHNGFFVVPLVLTKETE